MPRHLARNCDIQHSFALAGAFFVQTFLGLLAARLLAFQNFVSIEYLRKGSRIDSEDNIHVKGLG
jgi:hypothetical protein